MNKKYILYIYFLSLLSGNIISHEELDSSPYGLPIHIKAFLDLSELEFHNFLLLYRPLGNMEYIETPMLKIGNSAYEGIIPGEFCKREYIEYYLLLEMPNYTRTKFPFIDSDKNPIKVKINLLNQSQVLPDQKNSTIYEKDEYDIVGLEPSVVILSPKPGEKIYRHNLFIALSYYKMRDIDTSKIEILLDDLDVTQKANISSNYLVLPIYSMLPGIHTITMKVTNSFGQKFNDITWNFTVLPGEIKSESLIKKQSSFMRTSYNSGRINSINLDIGEIEYRHDLEFDWLKVKGKILKSSLENDFFQPYDRYSLELSNKFINLKVGDSFPHIGKFAWKGKRVRGINFLFSKDPISLQMISGTTIRAIQGDPYDNAMLISKIDSTTDNWEIIISRDNYTFQQDVSTFKLDINLNNVKWGINYLKIRDNILTVSNKVSNSKIIVPNQLISRLGLNLSDNIVDLDLLTNNMNASTSINILSDNWVGQKPKDNFIIGSDYQLILDDSRILISSGFSISLYNHNKWNYINNINEFDTLIYDSNIQLDGYFLGNLEIDSSASIDNYDQNFIFGQSSLPMIPFFMKKEDLSIGDYFNLPNLSKYSIIEFRYLGHSIKLGRKQNGPSYYSLLNSSVKKDLKETYFSDQFSLFKNKLLIYFRKNKLIEGLHSEISVPIETKNTLFNFGLYPGGTLPTFNFSFQQSNRQNNIETYKVVSDTVNNNLYIDEIIDDRIKLNVKNINISMTNQFNLWVPQKFSFHFMFLEQIDEIAKNQSDEILLSIGYLPKMFSSESYSININSIINNNWESNISFNTSQYNSGKTGFDYDGDGLNDLRYKQKVYNYKIQLLQNSLKYIDQIKYGIYYSIGRYTSFFTQYNYNISFNTQIFKGFYLNMLFDYRIKYLGGENKSPNDLIIRAQINYDIL